MAKKIRKGSVDMHTDQPPVQQPKEEKSKSNLDVQVKLDLALSGRLTVTVKLLQDGEVISEDYDFIQVN